jgi:protein-disulfide isomerase
MTLTRRALLAGLALAALATILPAHFSPASAQRKDGPDQVPVEDLMKPGDLADIALGPADAKVTVVEYASLTCPHCAHFATTEFAAFKTKYIDSGKVRYIFRAFPLNNLDAAAVMLTRCVAPDKSWPMIEVMYGTQETWAFAKGNPVPKLFEIAKQAGFTQETFDKCLTDQKLLDHVTAAREQASQKFGVNSTPTFFINGKRLREAPTVAELDKVIEPMLAQQ